MEKNKKLQGCFSELQDKVKEVVINYWDMFCEGGFHRPVRGFQYQIDTDNHRTICCKPPLYRTNEYEVMQKLVGRLDENGEVGEDNGPWAALVVIAAKPHQ